jgi:hypothetical protein
MITVKQILTYFPRKNDDDANFTGVMPIVYMTYIKPFLGTDFYNQLVSQYQSNTLTTDNNTFLKDYLQPIIAYLAMYQSLALRRAEPSANGILQQLPEFGQTPTQEQVGLSTTTILNSANSLIEVAKDYLTDNSSLYPLYKCGKDIKRSTPLYLGYGYNQVSLDKNV